MPASIASAQNLPPGRGEKAEHWETGVKYDANQLYLATIYGESHNATPIGNIGFANKAVNFEAVAQYQFLNGFRPSLGYVSSKGKNIENVGDAGCSNTRPWVPPTTSTRTCRSTANTASTC